MYVFAYGSLLDPDSVARTVGRPVAPSDLVDAVLLDHQRDWEIRIPVRSLVLKVELDALFLDLVPRAGAYVNGAILPATDDDIQRLAHREAQYELVDVSAQVIAPIPARVVTFRGRAEHRHSRDGIRCAVPERYREWVGRTVAARGPVFAERFAATTCPPAADAFPGEYTFADPAQAAATARTAPA